MLCVRFGQKPTSILNSESNIAIIFVLFKPIIPSLGESECVWGRGEVVTALLVILEEEANLPTR